MEVVLTIGIIILLGICVALIIHIRQQNELIQNASLTIDRIIGGDSNARIECNKEGKIYKLFHDINMLAAVMSAHADNEVRNKEFLKETIQDISHQLKTLISALSIYNEVLQGDDIDEDTIRHFNSLSEQEIGRMENLVQNLLKIAKLDAMSIQMEIKKENLRSILEESVERFSYRAVSEGKRLSIESGDEECDVLCDRTWISEAFDNLIKNALDHTEQNDTIVIKYIPAGDKVCILFEDSGSGIHEEDIYYIFNRFYRSRFAKDTSGIGLGLPLVKSILENNGGMVEVESIPGKGATFRVFLPIPTEL